MTLWFVFSSRLLVGPIFFALSIDQIKLIQSSNFWQTSDHDNVSWGVIRWLVDQSVRSPRRSSSKKKKKKREEIDENENKGEIKIKQCHDMRSRFDQ